MQFHVQQFIPKSQGKPNKQGIAWSFSRLAYEQFMDSLDSQPSVRVTGPFGKWPEQKRPSGKSKDKAQSDANVTDGKRDTMVTVRAPSTSASPPSSLKARGNHDWGLRGKAGCSVKRGAQERAWEPWNSQRIDATEYFQIHFKHPKSCWVKGGCQDKKSAWIICILTRTRGLIWKTKTNIWMCICGWVSILHA